MFENTLSLYVTDSLTSNALPDNKTAAVLTTLAGECFGILNDTFSALGTFPDRGAIKRAGLRNWGIVFSCIDNRGELLLYITEEIIFAGRALLDQGQLIFPAGSSFGVFDRLIVYGDHGIRKIGLYKTAS